MNKKIKYDGKKRVVSMPVLEQLCEQASSTCHRFEVANVSEDRVLIEYSNPDEYGFEVPLRAYLPCYKGAFNATMVVLDYTSVEGGRDETEREMAWQQFEQLFTTEYNPENQENKDDN